MTATSIQWTDATWNPVSGCTRVSAGCDNCYAVTMTRRLAAMGQEAKYGGLVNEGKRHFNGTVRTHDDALTIPLGWRKPRRIFVNSMSDLFHKDVPFEFIDRVYDVMCRTPQHTYQILTKRPERMAEFFGAREPGGALIRPPLPNVWLGTSVEDQDAADVRVPHLLRIPAVVRFLSCEPLLGPISLRHHIGPFCAHYSPPDGGPCDRYPGCTPPRIHWVIVGGESGPGARPFNLDWARSLIEQCRAAGAAVFLKQLGAAPQTPDLTHVRCGYELLPDASAYRLRLRDKKGGDMAEFPEDLRVREMPA